MPSLFIHLTLLFGLLVHFSSCHPRQLIREPFRTHPHPARDVSNGAETKCPNPARMLPDFFDYSVKIREVDPENQNVCPTAGANVFARADGTEDYSCGENKPCGNGACCANTGHCGYGQASCGTNGQSPNEKCWSNCDATAECGQYAATPNKTCPL